MREVSLVQDTKVDKRIHIIQYEDEIKKLKSSLENERERCMLKKIYFDSLK